MTHAYHPRNGGFNEPILFDDCEDCERHTIHLGLSLDLATWGRMWHRMLEVEYSSPGGSYRSANEKKLGQEMYYMSIVLERYFKINPRLQTVGQ